MFLTFPVGGEERKGGESSEPGWGVVRGGGEGGGWGAEELEGCLQGGEGANFRGPGCPPISASCSKLAEALRFQDGPSTFCAKSVQKVRLCTLLGALSGIGGNPTFCAD